MKGSRRLNNWRLKFEDLIFERKTKPFVWGENDCALFAADAILSISGTVDPAHHYRGRYFCEKTAMETLTLIDGNLTNAFDNAGLVRVSRQDLLVSDIVIAMLNHRETCGVCTGTDLAFLTIDGLKFLPLDKVKIICCWRLE
jgi:hypothetical protein